ncbi:glycerophosphodiester phosphodiesterase domain-containing protein 4 [Trichechus manatus latirostris]|uniref:Glycerophosphodiester phosphodiesterase domain-containing protein 4 n=1 Tax=Trichechus manatus latirostris TaxID=127582 RepID=A0A2Y9RL54_TRIMA|nr:glycerophosphodiester phosphodiesterase domain-containing protein 4 [Trichechus manatus latirostris]
MDQHLGLQLSLLLPDLQLLQVQGQISMQLDEGAIYLTTGIWFYWSIVLLSLFGILTAYTSLLLVLGFLLVWEGNKLYLHWCHKILVLLVTAVAVALLWVLCKLWKDKWLILGLSLKVFAPYWHLACITLMIIFSWPVSYYLVQLEGEARYRRYMMTYYERGKTKKCHVLTRLKALQMVVGLPFIIVLLFLYVMPLGIHSPCIQDKEKLGPKPTFFGHRGAPMFGPENTMMSFEKAVEHGAHGLESDVHISYDSVPFLMHDHNLKRTTNIEEVLPSAALNRSEFFTWDFLSSLNAGRWFLKPENKPFYHMEPLSEADNEKARSQTIAKLRDLLDLAQKEKKYVIFDLVAPPPKHPHRNTYVRLVVRVILDSKIEPHLIFWLPGFDRDYVRLMAPGFQQVGRLYSLDKLSKENIRIVNVDYKELFYDGLRVYKEANITINLYIVNKPWLFSLAWCSRIHSVTTDNIKLLSEIDHPYFFMTPRYYMFIWLLIDGISAILIFSIFYFHWWKGKQRDQEYISTNIRKDTQSRGPQERKIRETLSTQPLNRVSESPWTPKALYPGLASSTSHHSSAFRLTVPPKKNKAKKQLFKQNIKPVTPAKDNIKPPEPKKQLFEPTKTSVSCATRRSTLQTALPVLKVHECKIPTNMALHPKTNPTEAPIVQSSSQESFVTADTSFRMSWMKN